MSQVSKMSSIRGNLTQVVALQKQARGVSVRLYSTPSAQLPCGRDAPPWRPPAVPLELQGVLYVYATTPNISASNG